MFPNDWAPPPCGSCCTKKYAAIVEIPWRIFCKKGCSADGDTWEECLESCNEICYKDPVIKDYQWSSYIDRSPGDNNYSLKCFHACASGCGFKFGISPEEADRVHPNRPLPPPPPSPIAEKPSSTIDAKPTADDDLLGTSA